MYKEIVSFIKDTYKTDEFIPLHEPVFSSREKELVLECIDSTFVSSVGKFVNQFEEDICKFTGSKYAIAVVNGTAALHISLVVSDVCNEDEVITQALTFIATANAIKYCGASPIFLDSCEDNLGLSPLALEQFLLKYAEKRNDGYTYNNETGKRIKACVPMHVFGNPVKIDAIIKICNEYNIDVIEDCAESLGSYDKDGHTGLKSKMSIISFNGNKIITCGGGGIVLTQRDNTAKKLKHLTTTSKVPHAWEFIHDDIGYNYRMPNLNAALGCAQLEALPGLISKKRILYKHYKEFFDLKAMKLLGEEDGCRSNFWLQALLFNSEKEKESFLKCSNSLGVMTRPVWRLIPSLEFYSKCYSDELKNSKKFEKLIVNIPSSCNFEL